VSHPGVWKRSHGRASEAPPNERGGNRYVRPTANAPHSDPTPSGPSVRVLSVRFHPLELERGFTPLGVSGRREVSADLLFKKPFRLSPTIEIELGPDLRLLERSPAAKSPPRPTRSSCSNSFSGRAKTWAGSWNPH